MSGWTPAEPFRYERVIQRSRFLAITASVADTAAALATIDAVATPEATHNCWAWRIGDNYRFNDDGEPGGTAGRPILAAIDGAGADRVLVVVTRWYGGIKLGAGGLVRAYGGTAAECLRLAPREAIITMSRLRCRVDFALERPVRALATLHGGDIEGQTYVDDGAILHLHLPSATVDGFRTAVTDLCRGQVTFQDPSFDASTDPD